MRNKSALFTVKCVEHTMFHWFPPASRRVKLLGLYVSGVAVCIAMGREEGRKMVAVPALTTMYFSPSPPVITSVHTVADALFWIPD